MEERKIEGEDRWAIVELFGHQKIAGRISNEVLGGTSFVRVDVPESAEIAGFTKLFGGAAIYGITFVSQEIATAMAARLQKEPVSVYDLPPEYGEALRRMRAIAAPAEVAGDRPVVVVDTWDDDDDEEPV